jgi:hypothetical protein
MNFEMSDDDRELVIRALEHYYAYTSDLQTYFREFPQEVQNIQRETEAGDAIITRTRDEESVYEGLRCEVRSKIELRRMVVECRFPHRPRLDKEFKMIITAEGALALADSSIADLSRYLLAPVLFDKLIPDDPSDVPESY